MPSGAGRKGGSCKRKRNRKLPVIETRSLRPCLERDSMQSNSDASVPRSCTNSHSGTISSFSATPSLHGEVSSQDVTIPENKTTTSIGAFSHSVFDNGNILPGIPSISCVVSSPNIAVLDSTQNHISVGASFCVSPAVTAAAPVSTSFANTSSNHAAPSVATKKPFVLS